MYSPRAMKPHPCRGQVVEYFGVIRKHSKFFAYSAGVLITLNSVIELFDISLLLFRTNMAMLHPSELPDTMPTSRAPGHRGGDLHAPYKLKDSTWR
jgi:hypothetical protein